MRNPNLWGPDGEAIRRQRGRGRGPDDWDFRGAGRGGPRGGGRDMRGGPRGGPWGGPWGGPPPWLSQLFGPEFGGQFGGQRRGGGRAKVRRGDVRTAILAVLAEAEAEGTGPLNGYQLIQEITDRSNGHWKPSPGSVYPTISQLVDEDLLDYAPAGRKALQLTEAGKAYTQERAEELAAVWKPFAANADDEEAADFKQVIGQMVGAIVQVATNGTADQRDKAVRILADTRRQLYGLLAEGPDDVADEDGDDVSDEVADDVDEGTEER